MYSVIQGTCDTCTEISGSYNAGSLLSVCDNFWQVEKLKAEAKGSLESIIEKILTAVTRNIKIIVEMLFIEQDHIFNVVFGVVC
jgi:hypothetical protein